MTHSEPGSQISASPGSSSSESRADVVAPTTPEEAVASVLANGTTTEGSDTNRNDPAVVPEDSAPVSPENSENPASESTAAEDNSPEAVDDNKKKRKSRWRMRSSLSHRFVPLIILFALILSTLITLISYYTYRNAIIAKYRYSADNVARLASDIIDADKINYYLQSLEPDADFWRVERGLQHLVDQTSAAFITVFRATPDGKWTFVFDTTEPERNPGVEAYELGYSFNARDEYGDPQIDKITAELVKGHYYGPRTIPPLDNAPELLSVLMPLKDSAGTVQAHICVSFSWREVAAEQRQYLLRLILVELIITGIFCAFYVSCLQRFVIEPLNELAQRADKFLDQSASPGQMLDIFKQIHIESEDELKLLQLALQQMEEKINSHIVDLTVANRRASTDSLTGLYNREYFYRRVSDFLWVESNKALDKRNGCAFIMIDVDYFKLVNDSYGHAEGDDVLVNFAAAVKSTFRVDDVVARMGGDEFAVFCEAIASPEVVRKKVEILREKLTNVLIANSSKAISASIGVYVAAGEVDDYQTLYEFADRAMYKVKEHGRDGFEIFTHANVAVESPPSSSAPTA